MSHDSHLFHTREELESNDWKRCGNRFARESDQMMPLYEAKMLHHYDHRWATYEPDGNVSELSLADKRNQSLEVLPRYWVAAQEVEKRAQAKGWMRDWFLGWRDICRATDERTAISFAFPKAAAGNKVPLMTSMHDPSILASLIACQSSFIFDYCGRQKVGGISMNIFIWEQLPTLPPESLTPHTKWILRRTTELAYTTWDMQGFASDVGDTDSPFVWSPERRATIRAELDALFFCLYGISRNDVEHIMETFSITRKKDEVKYGSFRTKEMILAEYDRMVAVGVDLTNPLIDDENFTSTLNPPPGQGPRHPAR